MNCPNCAADLGMPGGSAFLFLPGDVMLCTNPKCEAMLELTGAHAWRRISEDELAQLPARTREVIRDARLQVKIFRANLGKRVRGEA